MGGTSGHDAGAGCCAAQRAPAAALATASQRLLLSDLDAHFHCSIIGTCLSAGELRRIVRRIAPLDDDASDIDIHHEGVRLAHGGGAGAKAIHKALEQRHTAAVKQFAKAADADAVLAKWNDALRVGDVPGAYWATLTHPAATLVVRQKAFGDVHMLSHLVGAANRADIRRLVALEAENEALKEQVAAQQQRLQDQHADHARALQQATDEVSWLRGRQQVSAAGDRAEDGDGNAQRDLAAAQAQRIDTMAARQRQTNDALDAMRAEIDALNAQLAASHAEARVLEAAVARLQAPGVCKDGDAPTLSNKQIVYVGGRPATIPAIRAFVERAGGRFQDHDGGLEDRKALLPAMVAAADVVVFPVDCVDHDSVSALKRVCQHQGIDYYPIRSASLASFVELMDRLSASNA